MTISTRYRLGRYWLAGIRVARRLGFGTAKGYFRTLLFHDIPGDRMDAFARLVDHLRARHGILSPEQAEAALQGRAAPSGDGPCLLTFDDGFKSDLAVARDILSPRGIRGLFFVCPGLIDLPDESRGRVMKENMRRLDASDDLELMSWEDVRELARLGHAIGSHSMTHRALSRLAAAEAEEETSESARRIEREVGARPRWFAYPFGNKESIDARGLRAVSRHYQFCRSGIRGLNGPASNPFVVWADSIDVGSPLEYQQLIVEGGFDLLYRAKRAALLSEAGPK